MAEDNKIGIDYGQNKKYDPDFPRPGVNSSSQTFRDNYSLIQNAIENLQKKQISVTGDIEGLSALFQASDGSIPLNLQLSEIETLEPGTYTLPSITVDKKGRVTEINEFQGNIDDLLSGGGPKEAFYRDMSEGWDMDYGGINAVPATWNDIETIRFYPDFDVAVYKTFRVGPLYDPTKPIVFETLWVVPPHYECSYYDGDEKIVGNKTTPKVNEFIEIGFEWKVNGKSWQATNGFNTVDYYRELSTIYEGLQKVTFVIPPKAFTDCDIVQFRLTRFGGGSEKIMTDTCNQDCEFPNRSNQNRLDFPTPRDQKDFYGGFIYQREGTLGTGFDTFTESLDFVGATMHQPVEKPCGFYKDLTSVTWNLDYGTSAKPFTRNDIEVVEFENCLDTVIYHDLVIPITYNPEHPITLKTIWSGRKIVCDATVELGFMFQINGTGFGNISDSGEFELDIIDFDLTFDTESCDMQYIVWHIPPNILKPCDVVTLRLGRYAEPPSGEIDKMRDACPGDDEPYPYYKGLGNGLDNYCYSVDFVGGDIYSSKHNSC